MGVTSFPCQITNQVAVGLGFDNKLCNCNCVIVIVAQSLGHNITIHFLFIVR